MTNVRQTLIDWAEQGNLPPENLRRALQLAGALPSAGGWRHFIERLLLWMGTVMVAAGVIFFLAYNWKDLGRFAKFGLVEALIVVALFLVWRLGLEQASGKAALLGAALLMGALLALVGQTYQTGADTFELFTAWALAILPWVLIGRFSALWLLWLGIVNLAVTLYDQTFPGVLGTLFGPEQILWVLFVLNTIALAIWEGLARAGIPWLRERWATRLLVTASGTLATILAVLDVVDSNSSDWGAPVWLALLALAVFIYRRRIRDLFVLAGVVLSAIVVIATFCGENLLNESDSLAFLFIGVLVIGLSAAGGWWLKQVAAEDEA